MKLAMGLRPALMGLVVSLLSACGGKHDASAGNFAAAIEQSLQERGHQCLGIVKWPVHLRKVDGHVATDVYPPELPARMAALRAAGLVHAEDAEIEDRSFYLSGRDRPKLPVLRYSLTEAAKPFLRKPQRLVHVTSPGDPEPVDLCWGRKSVDRVVKWRGPIKFGEYQAADVEYTYKIVHLAPWAHRPDIQQAFNSVKETLDGAGIKTLSRDVHLTSEGWEVKRSLID